MNNHTQCLSNMARAVADHKESFNGPINHLKSVAAKKLSSTTESLASALQYLSLSKDGKHEAKSIREHRDAFRNTQPHATINRYDMRHGEPLRLQQNGHSAKELVEELTNFLNSPFTPKQQAAISRWRVFEAEWMQQLNKDPRNIPVKDIIVIFSDLFFFGLLGTIEFTWVPDLIRNHNRLGECEMDRQKGSKYWSKIRMDPAPWYDVNDPRGPLTRLMSTLLHECIHAFFGMYCCERTCTDKLCQSVTLPAMGADGHGSAFCRIASWINIIAASELDENINVDIWRYIIGAPALGILPCMPKPEEMDGFPPCDRLVLWPIVAGSTPTGTPEEIAQQLREQAKSERANLVKMAGSNH